MKRLLRRLLYNTSSARPEPATARTAASEVDALILFLFFSAIQPTAPATKRNEKEEKEVKQKVSIVKDKTATKYF